MDRRAQGLQREQVTILLHKPVGYVSGQAEDGHQPAVTLVHAFRGPELGITWSSPGKRSAFVGTFSR